jgi:RNA methyltransferase, TrmH family
MKVKRYNKKSEYSFCFGASPVMDLLREKEEKVLKVVFKEGGLKDEDVIKLMEFVKSKGIEFEVNDHLVEKIASKENTYVVGVFEKYECELEKKENHVVLVNPTNPGNVGTVLRTMLAFGFKNIVLIRPAVDAFQPSLVRSAMGALFFVNFKYFSSFEEYRKVFPNQKVFSFMLDGGKEIGDVVFEKPFSLVFGNESNGLPSSFKDYGESVYIPQSKEIDSLNLSVSVGVALYLSSR